MVRTPDLSRRIIAVATVGLSLLIMGCPLSAGPESQATVASPTSPDLQVTPALTPHDIDDSDRRPTVVYTIDEARALVPFTVRVPTDTSLATFVMAGYYRSYGTNNLSLIYEPTNASPEEAHLHRIVIEESDADVVSGDPTDPIEIDGVSGQSVRGAGVVSIFWQKDGVSYSAGLFDPDDVFTKEDLVKLINSFE